MSTELRPIAALYIDPRGHYPTLPGVDCWDESRDARQWPGGCPVVAHPPCGAWSKLSHLYRRNDAELAPRAVNQIRQWGGVLEHPAESRLWDALGLPKPGEAGSRLEYSIEVEQVHWGHVARKRTWLYLVGIPREALERAPFPEREPSHWASGRRGMVAAYDNVPPGIKVCSAAQRRRTPILFAEYLVRLARASRPG